MKIRRRGADDGRTAVLANGLTAISTMTDPVVGQGYDAGR
jgi:hypothetical protein